MTAVRSCTTFGVAGVPIVPLLPILIIEKQNEFFSWKSVLIRQGDVQLLDLWWVASVIWAVAQRRRPRRHVGCRDRLTACMRGVVRNERESDISQIICPRCNALFCSCHRIKIHGHFPQALEFSHRLDSNTSFIQRPGRLHQSK